MHIAPTRRGRPLDADTTAHESASRSLDPDGRPHVSRPHELLLDGNARLYAENARRDASAANPGATSGAGPRFNDRILYVGMNSAVVAGKEQNRREAASLPAGSVIVGHSEDGAGGPDRVRVGGRVVDLSTPEGAVAFASSLELPAWQAERIADVLLRAASGSRDELARIAAEWARAERGGSIPSRLVLSGHCSGTGVWDGAGKEGNLTFESVQALADVMPAAAAQVEDIMLSACSTGYDEGTRRTSLASWKEHFPNLKTAWGYSSPSDYHSPTGWHAVAHIAAWQLATAGRKAHLDGPGAVRAEYEAFGAKPFVASNVATWSVADGYKRGP